MKLIRLWLPSPASSLSLVYCINKGVLETICGVLGPVSHREFGPANIYVFSIWAHKRNKPSSKCVISQQRSSRYLEHFHLYWKCQVCSKANSSWERKLLMALTDQESSRFYGLLSKFWQSGILLNNETPIVQAWQAQWPKHLWHKSQLAMFFIALVKC